jgi:cytochrome P450
VANTAYLYNLSRRPLLAYKQGASDGRAVKTSRLGPRNLHVVFDPSLAREMFSRDVVALEMPSFLRKPLVKLGGEHLVTVGDDDWTWRRSEANTLFGFMHRHDLEGVVRLTVQKQMDDWTAPTLALPQCLDALVGAVAVSALFGVEINT